MKENADKFKHKPAFIDENNEINYGDLHSTSISGATYISKKLNGERNKPIAVFIDRNVESIQTFFSVLYSGNFYAPIDINQPESRINLILDTLEPSLIINASSKDLPEINFTKNKIVSFDILKSHTERDFNLIDSIQSSIVDTDPIYSMFTSGSTGVPKGVLIAYRSVEDMIAQFEKEFSFSSESIFGNQAPFDFDVSVKDIYNNIQVGGTVVIIPKRYFSIPNQLTKFLNEYKINVGIWATSVLRIIENLNALDHEVPKYLEKLMFSGEVMPNKVLNYWRKALPEVEYVNLYGPTEITCNCSYYKVNKPFEDDDVLPIGSPFDNTRILLLDENNQKVKGNSTGEICVIGSSLALGYYNNQKLTDAAFTQNPLNDTYEEKIYRTGDLGYWDEDNNLMYVSRIDDQIKHMGHRIELGEIESHINSLDYVDASVCIYDSKNEKIYLFYESESGTRKKIYKDLMTKMPKYMIPNKMIKLESLPLNNNRKINRQLLKEEYINETS